jgi:sugar phosphate isomerase/epimerase
MRIAFSNIAWPPEQDAAVAAALTSAGITALEVAPGKLHPDPSTLSADACRDLRRRWEDRGLPIVAAQALLFGHPELTLFESAEARAATLAYLKRITAVCASLGAKSLVFGSPKNRLRGAMPVEQANGIAVEFFRELAVAAHEAGTCIVMEANPAEYGADFVTRADEALALVEAVAHPGFQFHLDAACLVMAGENLSLIDKAKSSLRHFHASEPNLAAIGSSGRIDLPAFAAALRRADYAGYVSIEMRQPEPFDLQTLIDAAHRVSAALN